KKGQFQIGMNLQTYVEGDFVFAFEGSKAEGSKAEGSKAEGSKAEGSKTEGSKTEGSKTQNSSEGITLSQKPKVNQKNSISQSAGFKTEEFSQSKRVGTRSSVSFPEVGRPPRHEPQIEPKSNRIEFEI